jgi:hypothetical protein
MELIKLSNVEEKIITLRNTKVIIDSDVAELYGVETKRINEAVKNNPDKFLEDYIILISFEEWKVLKSKISTLKNQGRGQHSKFVPKAFTEKGLYMLATILKSPKATQTTIDIIECFAKIKSLSQTIKEVSNTINNKQKQTLLEKSGRIIAELLDEDFQANEAETTIELNFAVLKFKHTIKSKKK